VVNDIVANDEVEDSGIKRDWLGGIGLKIIGAFLETSGEVVHNLIASRNDETWKWINSDRLIGVADGAPADTQRTNSKLDYCTDIPNGAAGGSKLHEACHLFNLRQDSGDTRDRALPVAEFLCLGAFPIDWHASENSATKQTTLRELIHRLRESERHDVEKEDRTTMKKRRHTLEQVTANWPTFRPDGTKAAPQF
jgi:hypothetical protein